MTSASQSVSFNPMRIPRLGAAYGIVVLFCTLLALIPSLKFTSSFWNREEYSHVYLIPPLALLTALYRFRDADIGGARWPGVVLTVLAMLPFTVATLAGLYTVQIYAAIFGLLGVVWSGVGTRGIRRMAAPIIYLAFMIPLPGALYQNLSTAMQHLSSEIGVGVMQFFGLAVSLDGNIIDLGASRLEVAAACNGLRYLFPLVSFGYLVAMLLEDSFWKKCVLVLSTLPIAVLMNAGRIAMIGVLVDVYGIQMAEGTQHEVEGFVVFFLCIVLLLIEVWLLLKVGKRGRFMALDVLLPDAQSLHAAARWPMSRAFVAAGLILVAGSVATSAMPRPTEVVPERRPLSLFPMDIVGWNGTPQAMEAEFLTMLRLTDYVLADYAKSSSSTPVNFYVAYYDSQKFGIQSHSPQQCLPNGGWNILNQSLIQIPMPDGSSIPVNRVLIEHQGVRQVAYFWFDERGRIMTNDVQLRYYAIRDSIVRGRSDGALVRLVTRVVDNDEAAADERLREFAWDVSGVLGKYVPN